MLKPLIEGDSVLAACVFKPDSQELPVCITLRAFDNIRKTYEKSETEEPLK
jgi:hypothetical protein